MKTQTLPTLSLLDPWFGVRLKWTTAEREARHLAETPPRHWGLLQPWQREALGGLAFAVLAKHGPLTPERLLFLQGRLLEALAATWSGESRGGYGDDLTGYHATDGVERAKWAKLNQLVASCGTTLSLELLRGLAAVGDLVETLRLRQLALMELLERAEKMTAPGARTDVEGVAARAAVGRVA